MSKCRDAQGLGCARVGMRKGWDAQGLGCATKKNNEEAPPVSSVFAEIINSSRVELSLVYSSLLLQVLFPVESTYVPWYYP